MRIYLKNNPAKFHPGPIWNTGALGFFEDGHPNEKKNKMSSDMWSVDSVPDLKIMYHSASCKIILLLSVFFDNQKRHSAVELLVLSMLNFPLNFVIYTIRISCY